MEQKTKQSTCVTSSNLKRDLNSRGSPPSGHLGSDSLAASKAVIHYRARSNPFSLPQAKQKTARWAVFVLFGCGGSGARRNDRTVVNKVPFGTLEPYGDRARRREGFEPHDLRVIASRPSSSRVVLRVRQAALPKLALWKTPLAKTPCPWRFGFANPTSHARRSHNPKALCQNFNLQIKKTRDTLRCLLFSLA